MATYSSGWAGAPAGGDEAARIRRQRLAELHAPLIEAVDVPARHATLSAGVQVHKHQGSFRKGFSDYQEAFNPKLRTTPE